MPNFSFPHRARIVKTDDFSSVFNFRKRLSGRFLALHYQPNQHQRPRLGLIVGKKTARLSVDRNYMKRVVREMFRNQQEQLPNIDLIVRVQIAFGRAKYDEVQQEFGQLLARLPMLLPSSELSTML